jgi:hypothetical protein
MAYKNPLRLAKNGHFFVSDATTLTSYKKGTNYLLDMRVTLIVLLEQKFNALFTIEK